MKDLVVKKIGYCRGKGVFANRNFKKGEKVFEFRGREVKIHLATYRGLQVSENTWINPYHKSLGHFLNHSCDPNCGISKSVNILAMKPVRSGEEITIDYSTTAGEKNWKLKCYCPSKKCRKTILAWQFLPKRLQKKFKLWRSEYLKKRK